MLNAVVLPAPFGPMRLTISPSSTEKFKSDKATRPPKRTADVLDLQSGGVRVAHARLLRIGFEGYAGAASWPPAFGAATSLERRHDAARQQKHNDDHQPP